MKPNISSSNVAGDRPINLQSNPAVGPPEMRSLNPSQQLRPLRTEQFRPESMCRNMYQQNYQSSLQNNNPHNQQLPQNMYQTQQQQIYQQQQQNYQRQQQNLRISSNQNLTTLLPNVNSCDVSQSNNFRNIQRDTRISPEDERVQMAPQTRPLSLQQPIRPPFDNSNYSIISNQTKAQTPKLLNDRTDSNFPNVSQADYNRTPNPKDYFVNPEKKSSGSDLNSHRISDVIKKPNEATTVLQTEIDPKNSNFKIETSLKSLDEQSLPPVKTCKSEADEVIFLPEQNKSSDLKSDSERKINDSNLNKKKKTQYKEKNSVENESITVGMVKKNIQFFEGNDTTKKPLKPEICVPKNVKSSKASPETIKRVTYKKEDESGVDETPVIHPYLRSIFQAPRKVAKIPQIKRNKTLKKSKQKKPLRKPTSSEYLRPPQYICMHYKLGKGNNPKTQIYGSKEELLAFFENTKSWRKLNRYESKSNGNVKKDKVVHKATTNGDIPTPKQTPSKLQTPSKRNLPASPAKTPSSPGTPGAKSLPKTPESPAPPTPLIKKVPMNKIQVGAAPSPNLKTVRSKVGSLANTTHKPGGGNVKIESHKIDLSNVQPRTEAKNEQYKRTGGDKKIQQVKLQWSAKSKIGSLENATYKPGGGDKKIESVKLDFKEKAKPKVGSKDNVKYTPGGGNVKIENQKLEFKAQSKVGSLDNVKHKPGGGDIKIFDDKTYLRQVSGNSSEGRASGTQAYGDLSVVRQVKTRNTHTTLEKKTSIEIKKSTIIKNTKKAPKITRVTEVTVTSQRLNKERETETSPAVTIVIVTYSKIYLSNNLVKESPVEFVKIPAKSHAPVLKPSFSKKNILSNPGSENHEYEKVENKSFFYSNNDNKSGKQDPKSPDLPENRLKLNSQVLELSKFLQDELAVQEKIGELWQERNIIKKAVN